MVPAVTTDRTPHHRTLPLQACDVVALGGFASPEAPAPVDAIAAGDLDAACDLVARAVDRMRTLVAVVGRADAQQARGTLHLARTASPDAVVLCHVSPLPPLARHLLVAMADALAGELHPAQLLAALGDLEDRLVSVAALGSVTRLEAPAPPFGLHALSWWPSSAFVVVAAPEPSVSRFSRKHPPALPASSREPGERVLVVAGTGSRSATAAAALRAALPCAATLELAPSAEAARWWGTRDVVEMCVGPLNLVQTRTEVRAACRPCAWCGSPRLPGRCPICGYQQDPAPQAGSDPALPAEGSDPASATPRPDPTLGGTTA